MTQPKILQIRQFATNMIRSQRRAILTTLAFVALGGLGGTAQAVAFASPSPRTRTQATRFSSFQPNRSVHIVSTAPLPPTTTGATCGSLRQGPTTASIAELGMPTSSCRASVTVAKRLFRDLVISQSTGYTGSIGPWYCASGNYDANSIFDFVCQRARRLIVVADDSGPLSHLATTVTDFYEIGTYIAQDTNAICILRSREAEIALVGTLTCPIFGQKQRWIGGELWKSRVSYQSSITLPGYLRCHLRDVDEDAAGGGTGTNDQVYVSSIRGSTARQLCRDLLGQELYVNDQG